MWGPRAATKDRRPFVLIRVRGRCIVNSVPNIACRYCRRSHERASDVKSCWERHTAQAAAESEDRRRRLHTEVPMPPVQRTPSPAARRYQESPPPHRREPLRDKHGQTQPPVGWDTPREQRVKRDPPERYQ